MSPWRIVTPSAVALAALYAVLTTALGWLVAEPLLHAAVPPGLPLAMTSRAAPAAYVLGAVIASAVPAPLGFVLGVVRGVRRRVPTSAARMTVLVAAVTLVEVAAVAWRVTSVRAMWADGVAQGGITPMVTLESLDHWWFGLRLAVEAWVVMLVAVVVGRRKPDVP